MTAVAGPRADAAARALPTGGDALDAAAVADLRASVVGRVLGPRDEGYDDARTVYNGMIDKRPALVVQARGVSDVQAAVRFARRHGLAVGVRGGGHSVAGHGTCDGSGLLVDLGAMRGVHVDPVARRAWVQGGATLRDVDAETQVHGLALPTGQVSATGVAGLTLNGGLGMLQRKHGLTCDNLVSARLVTGRGDVLHADDQDHPELMWALRGGGGNFGVVTEFEFALHPVGPLVLAGMLAFPVDRAPEVLEHLERTMRDAPEELSADALFMFAPPLAVIPEHLLGQRLVGIFVRWCGGIEEGQRVVAGLRELGDPVLDVIQPMPLTAVQTMLDPLNPHGNLHQWTGQFFPDLDGRAIETLSALGADLPTPFSLIEVIPFNGAPTRVPPDATAFAHRSESWLVHVLGQWTEESDTERCRAWVRGAAAQLRALSPDADAYLNLIGDDEGAERASAFWNEQRRHRLALVKREHDPSNTFRFNHNIEPAAPEEER